MSDLLETFALDEKQSRDFTTVLADKDGNHPTLLTAKMKLYNADLETTDPNYLINSRDGASGANANVLNAGNCTYNSTTGLFTWSIQPADTTIPTAEKDRGVTTVLYIAEVTFTYGAKTGGFRVALRITNWSAGALQLCTKADVLRHPALEGFRMAALGGDPDLAVEEYIEQVIGAVSRHAEAACARRFRRASYTDVFDIERGQSIVQVDAYPIVSIQSIKWSLEGDFASATALDASRYAMLANGRTGEIAMRLGCFPAGYQALEVQWTGGLATRTDTVPWDLRRAVADQVAFLVKRGKRIDLASEGRDQGSASYLADEEYTNLYRLALFTHQRA